MSTTTPPTDKPLEELSDSDLKQQERLAERTLARIEKLDAARLVAEGKADSTLEQMAQALDTVEEVDAERQRRVKVEDERLREQAPFAVKRWSEQEARTKKRAKVATVLGHVARFGHAELQGEKLVGSRLSDEELDELRDLVNRKRALLKGRANAEELTKAETERYERLVGQCAGDVELFQRKRRHKAARAKLGELKEERRVASLPKRPIYAEPGSIELPRSVFSWLVAEINRDGSSWGITEVGLLAAVLLSFENRIPILKDGHFVEEAGELVLVAPWGPARTSRLSTACRGASTTATAA
jgi:hypothetical protein